MLHKRAQIALFVIIAIMIVAAAGTFLYIQKTKTSSEKPAPAEFQLVSSAIKECFKEKSIEGMHYIGMQGGYYRTLPPFEVYNEKSVPYYLYQGLWMFPELERIQLEEEDYIRNNLGECLRIEDLKDYNISYSQIISKVDLAKSSVTFNSPIIINRGELSYILNNFEVKLDRDYRNIHGLISQIINEQKKDTSSFPLGFLSDFAYQNNFTFEFVSINKSVFMISLVFSENDERYVHSFLVDKAEKSELPSPEIPEETIIGEVIKAAVTGYIALEMLGGEPSEQAPEEPVPSQNELTKDSLIQDYGIDIGNGDLSNVEISGESAAIKSGNVVLTTKNLKEIDLQTSSNADASKFSGTIKSTTGGSSLNFISPSGSGSRIYLEKDAVIEMKDGKIISGNGFTIKPGEEMDFGGANTISGFGLSYDDSSSTLKTSQEFWINGRKYTPESGEISAEINRDNELEYTIKGSAVEHDKTTLEPKRKFDGQVMISEGKYNVRGGSFVTEYEFGRPVLDFAVSKDTEYNPNFDKTGCGKGKSSCISFDDYNNLRVVAKDNNNIHIVSSKDSVFPSLAVDRIDDDSAVSFKDIYSDEGSLTMFFDKNPMKIDNPSELKNLRTRIASQFSDTADKGKTKTVVIDNSMQDLRIIDKKVNIVGYYSEWAMDNYYKINGGVISKSDYNHFSELYSNAINAMKEDSDFEGLKGTPEERDFFITLGSKLKSALGDSAVDGRMNSIMASYYSPSQSYRDIANLNNPSLRSYYLRTMVGIANSNIGAFGSEYLENTITTIPDFLSQDPYILSRFFESTEAGIYSYGNNARSTKAYSKMIAIEGFNYRDPIIFDRMSRVIDGSGYDFVEKMDIIGRLFSQRFEGSSEEKTQKLMQAFEVLNNHYTKSSSADMNGEFVQGISYSTLANVLDMGSYAFEQGWGMEMAGLYFDLIQASDNEKAEMLLTVMKSKLSPQSASQLIELRRNDKYKGAIDKILFDKSYAWMGDINELHSDSAKRDALIRSIPHEIYPYILSQATERGIGDFGTMYRGTFDALLTSYARDVGGFNKVLTSVDKEGYSSNIQDNFILAVSLVGQVDKILPDDKALQEKYISRLLNNFQGQRPGDAGKLTFSMNNLLNNPNTKDSAEKMLFEEYNKLENSEDAKELVDNKKRVFQYWMLENIPEQKLAGIDFDSEVKALSARAHDIPVKDWVAHAETRNGIPVLKGKVFFTSLKDPNEAPHYYGLRSEGAAEGYVVKSTATGYVMTKNVEIPINGKKVKAIAEIEVTKTMDTASETLSDSKTFLVSNRGHCFDADTVWNKVMDQKTETADNVRKIGFLGSCWGAGKATKLGDLNENFDFIGTIGTGYGDINNDITLKTIDALSKGITDYKDLGNYMRNNYKGQYTGQIKSDYQFPETIYADLLIHS